MTGLSTHQSCCRQNLECSRVVWILVHDRLGTGNRTSASRNLACCWRETWGHIPASSLNVIPPHPQCDSKTHRIPLAIGSQDSESQGRGQDEEWMGCNLVPPTNFDCLLPSLPTGSGRRETCLLPPLLYKFWGEPGNFSTHLYNLALLAVAEEGSREDLGELFWNWKESCGGYCGQAGETMTE